MPSKRDSIKVSYDFSKAAKYNLGLLKLNLRDRGISATETGILEVLIDCADEAKLAAAYRRHLRD